MHASQPQVIAADDDHQRTQARTHGEKQKERDTNGQIDRHADRLTLSNPRSHCHTQEHY